MKKLVRRVLDAKEVPITKKYKKFIGASHFIPFRSRKKKKIIKNFAVYDQKICGKYTFFNCSFQRKNIFLKIITIKNELLLNTTLKPDYDHYIYKNSKIQYTLGTLLAQRFQLELTLPAKLYIKTTKGPAKFAMKFLKGFLEANDKLLIKYLFINYLKPFNGCFKKKKRRKKRKSRNSTKFRQTRFKMKFVGKWPSGQRQLF